MFTHSTLARGGRARCRRCGGVLNEPVSFCVHCGIFHPLDADFEPNVAPPTRPSATSMSSTPMASAADTSANVTPAILQASKLVVPDANVAPIIHHPLALSSKHLSLRTKGAALCVVSILAYGVLWLSTGRSNSVVAPNTGNSTDILAAARSDLAAHDLSGTRAAVDAALTTHPDNVDMQRLQSDLASLESRREAALRTARSCVKDGKWDCVRAGANDALAIDAGSAEAQALLQRAIVASGWMPLAGHEQQTAGELRAALVPHTATQAHTPARRYTNTPKPAPGVATRGDSTDGADGLGGDGSVGSVAGDDRDAEVRAIVESGWKHPPNNGVSVPPGGGGAAH